MCGWVGGGVGGWFYVIKKNFEQNGKSASHAVDLTLQRDPNIVFSLFCALVFPSIGVILLPGLPSWHFGSVTTTGSRDDSVAHCSTVHGGPVCCARMFARATSSMYTVRVFRTPPLLVSGAGHRSGLMSCRFHLGISISDSILVGL
jgi:hypothetical protein